jgi:hypothetical protein
LRRIRKHRFALAAIAAANFIFFFPVLFMARVVSPNDVFYSYDPWASARSFDIQNWLLNDPPTSYYTLMSLMKSGHAFAWNPFIASGIPGWGSSAAAVLSPFIAIPTLLLPLAWVYTGIIFLKLNTAFWFAYLWLREERLGRRGAAVGAIVFAASGAFAVRWLWQVTNATVLYPALLWIVCRIVRGKRVPFGVIALIALAYALAGFPSTMAYGAYVATAYFIFLCVRERRMPLRSVAAAALAVALALLIASPSLVPFIQFIRRTGYLDMRATMSSNSFPAHHMLSFLEPDRLGNPAYHNWNGDRALPVNNYVEATIYLGIVALPLIALSPFSRRARRRWYWLAVLLVVAAGMFGAPVIGRLLAALPGIRYSPLTRLQVVLPVAAAYLAAAGTLVVARRRFAGAIAMTLALLAAADLTVFAGRFHPYLRPQDTKVPSSPAIAYLQAQPKPFRIAPFFAWMWPNASELFALEDVRSHFSSEAAYRKMLLRVDPSSWSGTSTVITFNSLNFDFADPFLALLGVRYFVEQHAIDIIRWKVFEATVPGVAEVKFSNVEMKPGDVLERTIRVDAEPFWAIELPATMDSAAGATPRLMVSLRKNGAEVYTRAFTPEDMSALGKVYIPLQPYARLGESVTLRVEAFAMKATLLRGAPTVAGDAPIFYGRVTKPVIFDRELPDARLYLNVAELPRFHAVSRVRRMSEAELIAGKSLTFADEAFITDPHAALPPASPANVRLVKTSDSKQELVANGNAPFFIASSEKLTPELRVTIDGRDAEPIATNILFAGVAVPAGEHRVVFSRQIGGRWWWVAGFAALLVALLSFSLREKVPRSGG